MARVECNEQRSHLYIERKVWTLRLLGDPTCDGTEDDGGVLGWQRFCMCDYYYYYRSFAHAA